MTAVSDPALVRGLQERAARAMPAERVEPARGWWLRHAPDGAWWTGTVLPHAGTDPEDLAERITGAERFHTARGTVARFQITPGACPGELDAALAGRGYRRHGSLALMAAPAARVRSGVPEGAPRVLVEGRPAPAWLRVRGAAQGPGADLRAERATLARVRAPSAYACALAGDEVVAVGRAVADTGWAGVFGLATLPRARGGGAARAVLAALAAWAEEQGAGRMYLQVEEDNTPAVRLYGRAGFVRVRGYHYRSAR
ncbi:MULTISPECIES: GNAT family N-acetyltransferase [unclassified Nocardiopsis]|uniref:GNAT family N-acetyltransferase n=1 Tax=unclassified Nocardiopsis TaxID=2649073 RepID=UPI001F4321FA|nr:MULTISPECIES: GNAT family N-acetyltransferase [unclassified Nocardiopsis]